MVIRLALIQVHCLVFLRPPLHTHILCWLTERVGHLHFGQGFLWQVQQLREMT